MRAGIDVSLQPHNQDIKSIIDFNRNQPTGTSFSLLDDLFQTE